MEELLGERKKSRISSTVPPRLQVTAAWHKATPWDETAQHRPYIRSKEIHPLPLGENGNVGSLPLLLVTNLSRLS